METLKIDNNIVCYDSFNIDSKEELKNSLKGDLDESERLETLEKIKKAEDIEAFLDEENLKSILDEIKRDVILVLGGDGTMLEAINKNYKQDLPFFGINYGTEGFLLNNKEYLQKENKYVSRKYPLFKVRENGKTIGTYFNDIDFYPTKGSVLSIDVCLENKRHTNIKGSGVTISTPAGSTAHNGSLEGPIIDHGFPLLIITPTGSKDSKNPKVISDEQIVSIENIGRRSEVGVNVDGNQILVGKDISLEIKKSKKQVELLILDNYVDIWDNKGFNS